MEVQYKEGMANHLGPESCVFHREVKCEALTGETGRPAMEPRNLKSGTLTLFCQAESNMRHDDNRKPWISPTRSETLCTPGSYLSRSWEVSSVPDGTMSGGTGKNRINSIGSIGSVSIDPHRKSIDTDPIDPLSL